MNVELKHQPSFSLAVATLRPNEGIKVEPGAMVSFSAGITQETKVEGGFFGGLKRMVGGESFFQNTYTAGAQGGEITLAPSLPGDMIVIDIGAEGFMLQSGAYVASDLTVSFDTKWGGARGFFGGAGLLLLRVSGQGQVLAGCYGALETRILEPGQKYNVDTGHIVGFDDSIQFQVRGSGGLKNTVFGGEGLICELTGPGRVLMQTRSEQAFLNWLIPQLPQRNN
jgi:uncharacterized protein (TIGR00266 family)